MGAAEGTKMDDDFVEMERVIMMIEYLVFCAWVLIFSVLNFSRFTEN